MSEGEHPVAAGEAQPAPPPPAPLRMPERERRIGFLLAAAAVPAFALVQQPWRGGDRPVVALAGVGLAALLAGASWWGNRAAATLAGFAVAFGPWGVASVLGTPYMAFGFLLSFRASRASRAVVDARRASAAASRAGPERGRSATRPDLGVESGRVTPKGTARRRPPKRRR